MLLYQTLLICFFFIGLVPKSNISVFRPVSFQVRAGSPDRGPMVGEDILTKSTKKLHENCENCLFAQKNWGNKPVYGGDDDDDDELWHGGPTKGV